MNWVETLSGEERSVLNMLAGALNLPIITEYETRVHFIRDVYHRIVEVKALERQLSKLLGG